ncbi:uncharacterized protein [Littorina saxatilis]|uniref:Uncharacterized protein n=1 Tax=Littorina saxatilis TaxID=31220 RepID=A0AAN9BXJ4_9CAEN
MEYKINYGILLLASLAFISASVVQRQLDEESLHRDSRAAGCRIADGRTIAEGDNFTRLDTGPCVNYACKSGQVLPLDYGCYRDGRCYPLQDVYKLGCIERTCKLFNGRFDYAITREACTGQDQNTCIDVGTTVKDGCITYSCDKEQLAANSVSYHLRLAGVGCEYKGACVAENKTVVQGCRTMTCRKQYNAVGFFTTSNGCDINGKCVGVGETVQENCRTFACTEENLNGLKVLNIKPVKIQCKDSEDACHESGTYFPMEVNQQRANCTCQVQGLSIEYSCSSV